MITLWDLCTETKRACSFNKMDDYDGITLLIPHFCENIHLFHGQQINMVDRKIKRTK
jgi:hypothetical protein